MKTVRAIYQQGIFKPLEPTDLPEPCQVEFEPRIIALYQPSQETSPFLADPNPTAEELELLLVAMAARGAPRTLPADFSRDDLYVEHD